MKIVEKIAAIPHLNKALLPTPLEYLPNLSSSAGTGVYIKRDDLSGHSFGGNKERKLDYIIKDARLQERKTLLTVGAPHSNHCRMTAALGAVYGMKVELIIISAETNLDRDEGNMMLDMLFGANISIVPPQQVQSKIDEMMNSLDAPYFIEGGGHCVLGLIAYIAAAEELKIQCENKGILPEYIVLPCGTGTTLAGIAMGCSLINWDVKVLGISVARSEKRCREEIDSICGRGCDYLQIPQQQMKYEISDRFIGSGYGESYPESVAALKRVAVLEGIILDPIYNAKTMCGLLSGIENGNISGTVIYWNTGGQPALFIDRYSKELC
ncbi:MAG: hypothetical protein A2017_10850 [Lentisphaerae bacterium GWF2_44_16]|nr:MAG: hypothetical protein A2017_10850 [Lentisphaerae bacterium GWF2_44_16]